MPWRKSPARALALAREAGADIPPDAKVDFFCRCRVSSRSCGDQNAVIATTGSRVVIANAERAAAWDRGRVRISDYRTDPASGRHLLTVAIPGSLLTVETRSTEDSVQLFRLLGSGRSGPT